MELLPAITNHDFSSVVRFAQKLIEHKSLSGQEKQVANAASGKLGSSISMRLIPTRWAISSAD